MAKIEWSAYVPGARDEIVMKLRRGEWTPEQADEWAATNNEYPFIKKPDHARFDPMAQPDWTLAMALAWIIWRTSNDVREHWDAYLYECTEWRGHQARFEDGRTEIGWEARRRYPVSVADIMRECARLEPDDSTLNSVACREALWSEMKSGRLEATGVPHFVGGRDGIPLVRRDVANAEPRRMLIPKCEWIDLSPDYFHVGEADSIATATANEARYDEVRVWRDQVLQIWPANYGKVAVEIALTVKSKIQSTTSLQAKILKYANELWPNGDMPARVNERDRLIKAAFKRRGEVEPNPKTIQRAFASDRLGQ